MRGRFGQAVRLLGLIGAVLSLLAILIASPGHVLEEMGRDHRPAAPAAVLARADARLADWDHHIHGHACADHCAAHVLTIAPDAPTLSASAVVRAAWRTPPRSEGRSISLGRHTPPPRV